jgi:NAD(P)-dependent dehydrogenase (short-subunit alcohol dehydrogenase family)
MRKIAVVTGAGSGIGRACALALLQDGWCVALIGRRVAALQAVVDHAGADAQQALVVSADVSDANQVAKAFETIVTHWGRIDLLFNNAGVFTPYHLPGEMSSATWNEAVNVNLNGAFYCLSHAFAQMQTQTPRGGRIINNGSISAHVPRPGSIAYTTTKHAISGMTKAANLDGRAFDIAVGQIDIGNVVSDMTTQMAQGMRQADGTFKAEARMDMSGVVDTFMTMVRLPLSANILNVTVMATHMPLVGRG